MTSDIDRIGSQHTKESIFLFHVIVQSKFHWECVRSIKHIISFCATRRELKQIRFASARQIECSEFIDFITSVTSRSNYIIHYSHIRETNTFVCSMVTSEQQHTVFNFTFHGKRHTHVALIEVR